MQRNFWNIYCIFKLFCKSFKWLPLLQFWELVSKNEILRTISCIYFMKIRVNSWFAGTELVLVVTLVYKTCTINKYIKSSLIIHIMFFLLGWPIWFYYVNFPVLDDIKYIHWTRDAEVYVSRYLKSSSANSFGIGHPKNQTIFWKTVVDAKKKQILWWIC